MGDEKKEWSVGDHVWRGSYDHESFQAQCPACFGHRVLHVLRADDSVVDVPCEACERGYLGSQGTVQDWHRESSAEECVVTGREVKEGQQNCHPSMEGPRSVGSYRLTRLSDGKEIYAGDGEDLFATEDEAWVYARSLIEHTEEEEDRRLRHRKEGALKKCGWLVYYYTREIKEAQRKIAYAESRIKVWKTRAEYIEEKKAAKTANVKEGRK